MNIYVGNLSLDVTEAELRQAFAVFGQVASVSIMNDRYIGSGQTRGYGFVEMPLNFQGEAAIAELNGKKLKERVIDVVEALPLSDKSGNTPRNNRRGKRFSSKVRQRRS